MVQSYVDFVEQAKIENFEFGEPEIDVFHESAVAQYHWSMTYSLNAETYTERGDDLFFLRRRGGQWLVMWRAMLSQPASSSINSEQQ